MLTPFQGGVPRKPIGVQRLAAGVARLLFRAGKPLDVPADAPLRVERDVPGKVRIVWANGPADVVGIDGIGAASAIRINPKQIDVALSDGNVVRAPLRGGSAWRLTDPGVSLADPDLRLDGTIAAAPAP